MGITSFSIELIQSVLDKETITNVLELGAQNLYDKDYGRSAPYAHEYYNAKGIKYECIDLNGENDAKRIDLSLPCPGLQPYDLITDFGTSEHVGKNGTHNVQAFYNCLKTKHDLLKEGGVIISENPKEGNWEGHGFNYYTQEFYTKLIEANGYELIQMGEHPAMGNSVNGWNVYCIIKKVNNRPFMSLKDFKQLPIKTK